MRHPVPNLCLDQQRPGSGRWPRWSRPSGTAGLAGAGRSGAGIARAAACLGLWLIAAALVAAPGRGKTTADPQGKQAQEPQAAHQALQAVSLARSQDGHFTLDLDTPGGRLRLALDTGAQASAITRAAAERLGLPPAPGAMVLTLAGAAPAARRLLAAARMGQFALPPLAMPVLAHAPDSAGRLDGFLGLDAFAGEALRIDLGALRLARDERPACAPQPGLPETRGMVDGVSVRVRVDTGLAGSVGEPRLGQILRARGGRSTGSARLIAADGAEASASMVAVRRVVIDGHRPALADLAIADLPVFAGGPKPSAPVLIAGADLLEGAVVRLVASAQGACAVVEAGRRRRPTTQDGAGGQGRAASGSTGRRRALPANWRWRR